MGYELGHSGEVTSLVQIDGGKIEAGGPEKYRLRFGMVFDLKCLVNCTPFECLGNRACRSLQWEIIG